MQAYWPYMVGAGGMLVVLAIAALVRYRLLGGRVALLGMIRQSLLAFADGDTSQAALSLGNHRGPEAEAWNRLLAELDQLRQAALAERTADALATRNHAGSELESACDAMWQGLIVVDHDGCAKYVNGAAAVLLQTKRDAVLGQSVTQFIDHPDVVVAINAAVDGSAAQRRTFEIDREQPDETGTLRISVRPVRRNDPAAAVIVIEDVTQLKVAEEARHSFVAQVTHELRTPLTNIRLYVESLLDDPDNDPSLRTNGLNVINQESRRLEHIVSDMLSVAEIEAGSLQIARDDVKLQVLFDEIEQDYQAQANEKQIDFTVNLPPKLPLIQGDRDKITLALHNLVGNALKYTPPQGQVSVHVDATDDAVTVAVKDTGIGIDESEAERVFEKFYRANDKRVSELIGSGLGLSLAREVIRLHGGDINLESQIDQGSTFTLTLPVTEAA